MARRSREAGIRPLIGIPVPFCPPIREDWAAMADFSAASPVHDAFADELRALCAGQGHDPVDFREGLARHISETGVAPRSLYSDGLHLSEAGHRLFAAVLTRALRELGLSPATRQS
jgi:lysophospholipase L1-like esterase